MTLTCIAVDDEPLALGLVTKFIEQTPFLKLCGKYVSAAGALKAIHTQKIDLIFLDIQMAGLNGMELARVLEKNPGSPRIIFTTAFNQFALEGYKVDAIDYLLKPFNYEEFLQAAQKAFRYVRLIKEPVISEDYTDEKFLFLKVEHRLVRVDLDDIVFVESLKDYVRFELKNSLKSLLSLTSLKALEEKLPAKRFVRVNRSFIVAVDKIASMTKNTVQVGSKTISVGDQYKEGIMQFVGKWG